MVSPWYSPGRSLGPQGHSTSLCYPRDALQSADLWLRGPGKKARPGSTPHELLPGFFPPRSRPGCLQLISPDTSRSSRRTPADPGAVSWILRIPWTCPARRAGAPADSQTPPLPTATGLPLEECFPAFPGIGWRWKHFIFTPQARIQAEKRKKEKKKTTTKNQLLLFGGLGLADEPSPSLNRIGQEKRSCHSSPFAGLFSWAS